MHVHLGFSLTISSGMYLVWCASVDWRNLRISHDSLNLAILRHSSQQHGFIFGHQHSGLHFLLPVLAIFFASHLVPSPPDQAFVYCQSIRCANRWICLLRMGNQQSWRIGANCEAGAYRARKYPWMGFCQRHHELYCKFRNFDCEW